MSASSHSRFPTSALAGLTGSGLLVPTVEGGGAVKAVTYSSRKWRHLAGHDVAIVRASVGRHREARVLHRDDTELIRLVLGQLAALAGIRAAPVGAPGAPAGAAPCPSTRRVTWSGSAGSGPTWPGCRGSRSAGPPSTGSACRPASGPGTPPRATSSNT